MRYEIKGKVIDQKTREGVAGVRVEAWGTDLDLDDDLGYAATLYDGSFAIPFDEDTYRDFSTTDTRTSTWMFTAATSCWRAPRSPRTGE